MCRHSYHRHRHRYRGRDGCSRCRIRLPEDALQVSIVLCCMGKDKDAHSPGLWNVVNHEMAHIQVFTLRASCDAVYCNRSCGFVGLCVALLPR